MKNLEEYKPNVANGNTSEEFIVKQTPWSNEDTAIVLDYYWQVTNYWFNDTDKNGFLSVGELAKILGRTVGSVSMRLSIFNGIDRKKIITPHSNTDLKLWNHYVEGGYLIELSELRKRALERIGYKLQTWSKPNPEEGIDDDLRIA